MKPSSLNLPPEIAKMAQQHFVLLKPENIKRQRDSLSINLSGYCDVAQLISDITKVCILALGDGENHSLTNIPQPESNVSGVLSIILDLIPYEEFQLLDNLREAVLTQTEEEVDWDFLLISHTLRRPPGQENQNTIPEEYFYNQSSTRILN